MMTIGKNTVSGDKLSAFISRIEDLRAQRKELGAQENLVWAEVKAEGFNKQIMNGIIKRRTLSPSEIDEAESLRDMYLHALGMLPEPPLFRAVGLMNTDRNARESVIDALKQLVPDTGEIILNIGDAPVVLWRDAEGTVQHKPWQPPQPEVPPNFPTRATPAPAAAPPPNVDEDTAEEMGRQAFRDDKPIISNPFPARTPHRARFDLGYRKESGGDGMGGE